MLINEIYLKFMDFFFNDCLLCKEESLHYNDLCSKCKSLLKEFNSCFLCPMNSICICEFKSFIPLFYNEISRKLILQFKYNSKDFLSDFFAKLIINITDIKQYCQDNETVFISIPVTQSRLLKREYNQSVILSESLANLLNGKTQHFVFKKKKNFSQQGQDADKRLKNVQSIVLNEICGIINKNVCIVDDVIASGNTINRCVNLIKPYAKNIYIAAIAKS